MENMCGCEEVLVTVSCMCVCVCSVGKCGCGCWCGYVVHVALDRQTFYVLLCTLYLNVFLYISI